MRWSEGPHYQSRRRDVFVRDAAHAPHEDDEERDPVFPPELRPAPGTGRDAGSPAGTVWRFRVPDGEAVRFTDAERGPQTFRALRLSTARQLLVYRALGATPPAWSHLTLVRDAEGRRLAKRHQSLSIRELRARGLTPEEVPELAQRRGA